MDLRGRHERRAGRALAGLYEEHGAAVFAFALHLCGSREDAEDLVQTAYLQAFRALSAGEQLVNPRAWLMVVIRRQTYNLWRDRRETAVEHVAETAAPEADAEALAELRRVRSVLFSLPEAQHQAFVLRHWSGLPNREIAEVLGTTESAVETLLVRARGAIIASGEGAEAACAGVRERLAQGVATAPPDVSHIAGCRGCRRAQERLTRIAAAAAIAGLLPRAHVAQALAAAAPGFSAGGGAAAGLAAGKASAAKLAIAGVLSAGTIAVTAPVAVHILHHHAHHSTTRAAHSQDRPHQEHPAAAQVRVAAPSAAATATTGTQPHRESSDRTDSQSRPGGGGDGQDTTSTQSTGTDTQQSDGGSSGGDTQSSSSSDTQGSSSGDGSQTTDSSGGQDGGSSQSSSDGTSGG
ncbi:MAG TPA: sigma-70 family RNA polymerase sigma factor [Gaiellales bacterium]|nr:sigma-70 family RNA polymerase sigma factor [Gaiellales bacterium]